MCCSRSRALTAPTWAEMRIERIEVAEIERLGGPAGVAKQLRELVPDGASVEQAVREIVAEVRARGDVAVLDYTQRFDTAGASRARCSSRRRSSTRRSSRSRSSSSPACR